MKKVLLVTLIIVFNFPVTHAQDYSSAGAYMSYFSDQYKVVSKDMWDYMSAIARGKNARKVENRRKELVASVKQVKSKIAAVRPYKEDASLRDSTVAFLQLNYDILNDDYEKIVDLEEIAEQSYDDMEAYMNIRKKANEKMNEASESIEGAQKRFAAAHDVNLLEDNSKLSKKIERADKAFNYYDQVFLIYFKSGIQETKMVEAFNKSDMNSAEQCKNALKQYAAEGVDKLKEIKPYEGDASVTVACKNLLDFYKKEAELKAPIVIDFYLKKENFEKLKNAMDAKGKSATKEEIDEYNKSVKDYNAMTGSFNKTNDEMNRERSEKLNAWNNAVKAFLDKHAS
jgi:hypothetical protein